MKINVGECAAALSIAAVAGTMVAIASGYPIGHLRDMGPGYFPIMLGGATIALSLATLVTVAGAQTKAPDVPWRALALVILGMTAWAVLAERAGLVPASVTLILLASLARPPFRAASALATAIVVSLLAVALFIYGFDLPLRPVKW